MPFGIRPSNVRVCHFTTRAKVRGTVCRVRLFTQGENFRLIEVSTCEILRGSHKGYHFMSYAVIQTGGKQYRVAEGDLIEVEKLDIEAGAEAKLEEVLLISDGTKVSIGTPLLKGAAVTAEVVEQFKDEKVIAFKFKRRKGYHRTVGHRRQLTRLKIKSITA